MPGTLEPVAAGRVGVDRHRRARPSRTQRRGDRRGRRDHPVDTVSAPSAARALNKRLPASGCPSAGSSTRRATSSRSVAPPCSGWPPATDGPRPAPCWNSRCPVDAYRRLVPGYADDYDDGVRHPAGLPRGRRRRLADAARLRRSRARPPGPEPGGAGAVGRSALRRGGRPVRHHAQRLRRRCRRPGPTRSASSATRRPSWCRASDRWAVPTTSRPCRRTSTRSPTADGDARRIPDGPWDDWTDRDLDEVNVERAARLAGDDHEVPAAMLRRLGLT